MNEAALTDTNTERVYFMFACQGWSGSNWTANALNLHPDIRCHHSARNLEPGAEEISDHTALARDAHIWHAAYANRTAIAIDKVYDDIEVDDPSMVIGSVHTYRLRDIPAQLQQFGAPKRCYRVANLVRHPISFVWSGMGQLHDMFHYDPFVLHGSLNLVFGAAKDEVSELAERHALNLCAFDTLAFVAAAANLLNLAKDIGIVPGAPWFRMEDLTTDRDAWSACVSRLTDDRVPVTDDYLDQVFGLRPLNGHKKGAALSPTERWQSWSDWQREAFALFYSMAGIASVYRDLGYELDFLNA